MPVDPRTRIGQLLIQRGLLARAQLVKALSTQMVYGGRLGTNLIESEFVSIDDVSDTLAAQHGVSSASRQLLSEVDDAAVSLFTQELAQQFSAVPLASRGSEILVAMMDPGPERVAELSHSVGRPIRPYAAPELRLLYLLERHYGIARPNRFLRLPDGSGQPGGRRRYLAPTVGGQRGAGAQPQPNRVDVAPLAGQTSHYRAVAGHSPLTLEGSGGGAGVFEHLPVTPGGTGEHRAVGSSDPRPVDHVLRALAAVDGGGALARLLVHPLCSQAAVSVLFWVRGKMAIGCCAHGVGAPLGKLQQLVLPLDGPSLMHWACDLHSLVRAQGDYDAMQATIAGFLDTAMPTDVCVAPVILSERVVNLIVVHAHADRFDAVALQDYRELAGAATTAYANLKGRIR